jgi:hypothetical protein
MCGQHGQRPQQCHAGGVEREQPLRHLADGVDPTADGYLVQCADKAYAKWLFGVLLQPLDEPIP